MTPPPARSTGAIVVGYAFLVLGGLAALVTIANLATALSPNTYRPHRAWSMALSIFALFFGTLYWLRHGFRLINSRPRAGLGDSLVMALFGAAGIAAGLTSPTDLLMIVTGSLILGSALLTMFYAGRPV